MFLLAIALACGPLCSWADSQMHKQMESRRQVPMKEDVLFHQNHAEIGPMFIGLHPIFQMTKYLSLQWHPTVTEPWTVNTAQCLGGLPSQKQPCVF